MGARWKHFKTICKHKAAVYKQCKSCGIWWQGVTHDLSKFSPIEFSSSAKYFQGNRSPIDAAKEACGYSLAWQHHMGHNPHHWEYWIDYANDGGIIALKIPYKYVVEMICDWIGAGKVYGGGNWTQHDPLAYYEKVRKGRYFHPDTEALILKFLRRIDEAGFDGVMGFYWLVRQEKMFYERVHYAKMVRGDALCNG